MSPRSCERSPKSWRRNRIQRERVAGGRDEEDLAIFFFPSQITLVPNVVSLSLLLSGLFLFFNLFLSFFVLSFYLMHYIDHRKMVLNSDIFFESGCHPCKRTDLTGTAKGGTSIVSKSLNLHRRWVVEKPRFWKPGFSKPTPSLSLVNPA